MKLGLLLILSTLSICRCDDEDFNEFDDDFDEFGDDGDVVMEIKKNLVDDYADPLPEVLPRKRHDILIQFCSS